MKKTLSIVLITTILIVALVVGLSAILVSGEPVGTAVTSAADFAAMSADGQYYLTANIAVSATYEVTFTGTLDGNGKTITTSVPLFNEVSGTVKNLTVGGSLLLDYNRACRCSRKVGKWSYFYKCNKQCLSFGIHNNCGCS